MDKNENNLLPLDLNLPNNIIELKTLERKMEENITPKMEQFKKYTIIDEEVYNKFVDEILRVLYKAAKLTTPIFNIRDVLEEEYHLFYRHDPAIAKKQWQRHYHELHKPYNVIKNTCFDYLDYLEDRYCRLNKKKPIIYDRITI
jgi:hypothetical protein